uniref:Aryl hydrocarbon receptor nuclear translocator homolog n=1 Tax=Diabrotica virgifera virgifera TaxID=50390 RepID=A0A6P7GIN8_DIAVI
MVSRCPTRPSIRGRNYQFKPNQIINPGYKSRQRPATSDMAGSNVALTFVSRLSIDGEITFLDQGVTHVLGYSTADLLGRVCLDFIHPEDQTDMIECFVEVLTSKGERLSVKYKFLAANGEWVWLRSSAFAFVNPYTEDVEFIVCLNSSTEAPDS